MKCKNCQNTLLDSDQFCTKCGFPVDKKENISLAKNTARGSSKFCSTLLNFLQQNWFKICILVLLSIFVALLLSNGIKINVRHSGYIDLDLSGDVDTNIDGATLWLE